MTALRLAGIRYAFEGGAPVIHDVSLELATGEFFGLLGPSGSGKSTLLRLIGGYLLPQAGAVWLGEVDVTHVAPERRNVGMVFQNYALFPHLDAARNVEFGLRVRGMGKAEREAKARETLAWVGLSPAEGRRLPGQLSGGQQQRVALARALVFDPGLLMLDEPFANLDRSLRERVRDDVRALQARLGTTTILVTHDRDEAFALCDRMGILHEGRLEQIGTPEELFRRPRNLAVARLLGHRNVMDAASARLCGLDGASVLWPEKLRLHPAGQGMRGVIKRIAFAGSHRAVTVRLDVGPTLEVNCGEVFNARTDDAVGIEITEAAVTRLADA